MRSTGGAVALAALPRQRLDPVHLLQDRALVLGLRLGQRVAQLDQRAGVVDRDADFLGCAPSSLRSTTVEELLLLADDGRRFGVGSDVLGSLRRRRS